MSDRPEDFAARNCPPEDREAFFRENAVACIEQRDAKIQRQAKRLAALEKSCACLRGQRNLLRVIAELAVQAIDGFCGAECQHLPECEIARPGGECSCGTELLRQARDDLVAAAKAACHPLSLPPL